MMERITRHPWLGLMGWLVLCYGAALVGSQFTPGVWYAQLDKPDWTPPDAVFGPVWTILYGLMAIAAWLAWKQHGFSGAPGALGLFLAQLVLNATWSWLFFGLEDPALGLIDITLLWVVLLATTVAFWRRRRLAGGLLLPYLLWVTFAGALNFEIWRMN